MTDEPEHRGFEDALSAYALGALSPDEGERLSEHLQGCRECRAQLEWLRAAVDTLPASVPQIEPPPSLRERVMELVTAEAELLRAAGAEADRPQPATSPRRVGSAGWLRRPALGFGLAAACAAVAAVIALLATSGTSTRTIQAGLSPALAGRAEASVRVSGRHAELVVSGLPTPPVGHVDEVWIVGSDSRPRPAGTFIVRSGSVAVAGAVASGDRLLVTVEPGAGTALPTTTPFITAKL